MKSNSKFIIYYKKYNLIIYLNSNLNISMHILYEVMACSCGLEPLSNTFLDPLTPL